MGVPTTRPHPPKDATRGEWMEAIARLDAEARASRIMAGIAIIGAAIIAAIILAYP